MTNSDAAERAVIGAAFLSADVPGRARLRPDDFRDRDLGLIWTGILELAAAGRPIDGILLPDQLNGRSHRLDFGKLSDCLSAASTADNVEHHAAIVAEAARERRLRSSLVDLVTDKRLEATELLQRAKELITELEAPVPGTSPRPPERAYGIQMSELMAEEDDLDDLTDWRVRGFIPSVGPSMIVGEPKAKKTFIAEHQAVAVAAGVPNWLGSEDFGIRCGRVLILALEDHYKVTRRRIRRIAWGLGYDPRDLENLRVEPNVIPFRFDRQADVARLRRGLDAWTPDLIYVDSLSKTHGVDENSVKEMAPVLEAWEAICRDYKCAVTTLHHMNKPTTANSKARTGNRLRGSTSIFAFVRYLVGVELVDKEHSDISVDGNMLYQPDPFTIELSDGISAHGKYTTELRHAGTKAKRAIQDLKEPILTALLEGESTSEQIAKTIRRQKNSVLVALRELMADRKVRNEDRKWRRV